MTARETEAPMTAVTQGLVQVDSTHTVRGHLKDQDLEMTAPGARDAMVPTKTATMDGNAGVRMMTEHREMVVNPMVIQAHREAVGVLQTLDGVATTTTTIAPKMAVVEDRVRKMIHGNHRCLVRVSMPRM